jgi:trk system potassium uptake protein TrkH
LGVLVLFLAVLPNVGAGRGTLVRTENSSDRLVPRLTSSVKRLYIIYASLTVLEILSLVIAGLPLFDAAALSFSTAGTGGMTVTNGGVQEYGAAVSAILSVFMFLFSINFAVYYVLVAKRRLNWRRNTELKAYVALIAASVILVWVSLLGQYSPLDALRQSAFSVTSYSSTTAFSHGEWSAWPAFPRLLLLMLPIIGACSGSTGCGIKMSRAVILVKAMGREIKRSVRPREVSVIRVDGKAVEESAVSAAFVYLALFTSITIVSALALSLERGMGEAFAAALSCITNTGGDSIFGSPGLYRELSPLSKCLLSVCMLCGRLEIFPLLALASPAAWRRK